MKTEPKKKERRERAKLVTVQKNELVRNAFYRQLSVQDLKLMKLIISKINSRNTLFDEFYTISYEDLDHIMKPSRNRYEIVTESLKKLSAFFVDIETKDEDGNNGVNINTYGLIQNKWVYKKHSRNIVVYIHDDLQQLLLDIKNEFTRYEVKYLKEFTSKYDIKLYEYLKSFEGMEFVVITIDKVREILELKPEQYPKYANMKQTFLKKSFDNINKNTDLTVDFLEIKEGRKITKLKITIYPNQELLTRNEIRDFINASIGKSTEIAGERIIIKDIKYLREGDNTGYKIMIYNESADAIGSPNRLYTFDELKNYIWSNYQS